MAYGVSRSQETWERKRWCDGSRTMANHWLIQLRGSKDTIILVYNYLTNYKCQQRKGDKTHFVPFSSILILFEHEIFEMPSLMLLPCKESKKNPQLAATQFWGAYPIDEYSSPAYGAILPRRRKLYTLNETLTLDTIPSRHDIFIDFHMLHSWPHDSAYAFSTKCSFLSFATSQNMTNRLLHHLCMVDDQVFSRIQDSAHAVSLPLSAFLSYPAVSEGSQLQLSVLRPFEALKTACKWMHASGCLIFQALNLLCPVVQASPWHHCWFSTKHKFHTKQLYFTAAWYEGLGSLCLRRPLFGSLAAGSRSRRPTHQAEASTVPQCATQCAMPAPVLSLHVQWQKQLMPSWRPKWSGGTWRYQRYHGITESSYLLQPLSAWSGDPKGPISWWWFVRFAAFTVGLRHEIPDICSFMIHDVRSSAVVVCNQDTKMRVGALWSQLMFNPILQCARCQQTVLRSWIISFTSNFWKAKLQRKRNIFVASLVHFHPGAICFSGSFSQNSSGM